MDLLEQIRSEYGLAVLVLVLVIFFGCLLAWKLIWQVWSRAMQAKDEEIVRLVRERDKYQALLLERFSASPIMATAAPAEARASRPVIEQRENSKQQAEVT